MRWMWKGRIFMFFSGHGANVSGIDPNPDRISAASAQARTVGLRVGFYEGFAKTCHSQMVNLML